MFNNEQLKTIREIINELLDSNTVVRQPVYMKPKRWGTYNHQITSGVTDEMFERINAYCSNRGICKAELIRTAVNAYLNLVCDPNLVGIDFDRILGSSANHV